MSSQENLLQLQEQFNQIHDVYQIKLNTASSKYQAKVKELSDCIDSLEKQVIGYMAEEQSAAASSQLKQSRVVQVVQN